MSQIQGSSQKRHLSLFIRILVAVAILYFVFRGQDWATLRTLFMSLDLLAFALAVAIFILCQATVALRWWLILRSQKVYISYWSSVRLVFLGLFYNNFLPSSVGGDLVRAWYVTKHTNRRFEAALSVPVDRVIGLFGIAVLAVIAWGALLGWSRLELGQGYAHRAAGALWQYGWLWQGTLAVLVLLAVIVIAAAPLRKRIIYAAGIIYGRSRSLIERLHKAGLLYLKSPATVSVALLITLASQALVVVAFWIVGRGMGIEADFKYYLVFFPLSWVLGAVPISPAGVGIVEGWLVLLFTRNTGISMEAATALAICQRVIWMLVSMPGLAIYLTGGHLPKDFSVDYPKTIN